LLDVIGGIIAFGPSALRHADSAAETTSLTTY
jgi:hypothetical protein